LFGSAWVLRYPIEHQIHQIKTSFLKECNWMSTVAARCISLCKLLSRAGGGKRWEHLPNSQAVCQAAGLPSNEFSTANDGARGARTVVAIVMGRFSRASLALFVKILATISMETAIGIT
jgi:hypothetical protein